MNPYDLIAIIADDLPIEQAIDLVCWYSRLESTKVFIKSDQFRWWVGRHAGEIGRHSANDLGRKR